MYILKLRHGENKIYFNEELEFTKQYKYLLEKCSWSTPLLLPTILHNCVFVIKLCIPRIAINIEKENYLLFPSVLNIKNFKNQKFLSNILTFSLTFSYSIKYRFFSRKKKRDKVIKNYLQSLSLQCPYYFPHISEFRHIAVACLTLKVNLCLAPTGGYERKLKWSIFAVHLSHKVSNKIMLYRADFQLNLHYLLTHILIYICILAKSRIIKVWLNSHV